MEAAVASMLIGNIDFCSLRHRISNNQISKSNSSGCWGGAYGEKNNNNLTMNKKNRQISEYRKRKFLFHHNEPESNAK